MIKKIYFLLCCICISFATQAQVLVKGTVLDKDTKEPLVGVTVFEPTSKVSTITNLDGTFNLKLSSVANKKIELTYIGYLKQELSASENMGEILLAPDAFILGDIVVTASVAIQRKTPVALSVIEPDQIDLKLGTQEYPEILKWTPGIYATKQGGGFGDARVNVRGFESPNVAVMINGVPMNDMEWGGVYWSNWGALSDVTRSMQVQRGLGASKVAAPSLGGSINVVTKSTDMEKGGSAMYGIGNDGYNKIGFSFSTGLTSNNWAVTMLGTKTTSNGYIQGTEYEAYSYFVNISKIINSDHQLSFTAFSAPQWHNQRNNSDRLLISEWQKQPLKYKYNASYGFDMNGQRKKSAYNYYNKPQLSLSHYWTINQKSSLTNVIYMSIGDGGGWSGQGYTPADRTNWYGASNGVPNGTNGTNIEFRSADGTFNYGEIYKRNKDSEAAGSSSKMVMSTSENKHTWFGAISTFTTQFGDNINFYGGVDLRYYKGVHTNKITDLYGGKFFIDATDRPNLNNTDWKTRKLGVGDVVYRDYDGFVASEGIFGQAEYNKDKLSTFISLSASNTSNWRYDRFYYEKEDARSKTVNFLGYCAKGGANYNFDDNHNVFGNIGIISRAPFFSGGAFLQSTTSNETNKNAVNEKAFSAEVGYGYRSRYFTANLNLYRTNWIDKTMVRYINASQEGSLVANLQGVNALHQGIELDLTAKPLNDLEITGMISLGDWYWQKNASGRLYNSQGQPVDAQGNIVDMLSPEHAKIDVNLGGIKVGNSAQMTAALGAKYELLKGFHIGMDGNFYGKNYANFNISSIGSSLNPANFSQPWQIPDAFVFDGFARYSFKINGLNASITGNVNNLFDNIYISDATDGSNHTWETSPVFYGFGRTWSLNLKVRF